MGDAEGIIAYCIVCGDLLDSIACISGEKECPRCASRDVFDSDLYSDALEDDAVTEQPKPLCEWCGEEIRIPYRTFERDPQKFMVAVLKCRHCLAPISKVRI